MQTILKLIAAIIVVLTGWEIGNHLTPDAIALALGVLLGTFAGIPIALIALHKPAQAQAQAQAPQRYIVVTTTQNMPAIRSETVTIVRQRTNQEI